MSLFINNNVLKYLQSEEHMEYTGMHRTCLSDKERRELRRIASQRGMTLTGFCDAVLRAEIRKEEEGKRGTQDHRAR